MHHPSSPIISLLLWFYWSGLAISTKDQLIYNNQTLASANISLTKFDNRNPSGERLVRLTTDGRCKPERDIYTVEQLHKCIDNLKIEKHEISLVSGGAGFVGSHLVDRLMLKGNRVIVCDNFDTGRLKNIDHWLGHQNFELINRDIAEPLNLQVNRIYHLASPASPAHYMKDPIQTIRTNTLGTINLLELAAKYGARIIIASTSEVYGDPLVHPQVETYWGNVNPIGPRSCYDESKRVSESLAIAYSNKKNVSVAIARIFNTYGPRMHPNDGRVISNFITQTLLNKPITVYGTGEQTRSFQYIDDLVNGIEKLMESSVRGPVNLGNPEELTIRSLASRIKGLMVNSTSYIVYNKLPVDDPHRRRPDVSEALKLLNWQPMTTLADGLIKTIDYFNNEVALG